LTVNFMKTRINCARLAALPLALAAAFGHSMSSAQTMAPALGPTQLKEVFVSATRNPARVDDLVSDVVVIDRADIEQSAGRTLPELLARVPGVQFNSNGGLGKNSSMIIRGTEARHALLLIDGVRYGSATAGTPAWDNIPVDMIERIEVVKGPVSALYGSEAVGGVVQIFLRKGAGDKPFKPYAALTLGSENFNELAAGFTGAQGAARYALAAQRTRVTGISSTNVKVPFGNFNPDNDGFEQNSYNASLSYQINTSWKVDAGLLQSDGVVRIDDGLGRDSRTAVRTTTARVGVEAQLSSGWKSQLRLSQSADTSRAIVAAPANLPGLFKTTQNQLSWQNDVSTPLGVVLLGLENLTQKVDSTTLYTVTQRDVMSYFAGINGNAGKHSWQANARRDNNSQFGGSSTGFAGYGYSLSPAWRVNASYGTSFVAPSFNQLYFPAFGNAALQPERGKNTDVGVTWSQSGHTVKLVKYDNRIRGFITNTTLAVNIPQARIDGTTLAYTGEFGALSLNASLDALNPRNELTGKTLVRRSKSVQRLSADYAVGAWNMGATLLRVGDSFNDAANTQKLDGYTTADLYADYKIDKDWRLQVKLNNLTNKQYETTLGYNQPGRGAFVTLRWQPK
jgi:vitamin B12 transporter